jgi:hypothetical protein
MLFVGAVQISLGWAWHTVHRARLHWSLKREGALLAAAVVAIVGAVDMARKLTAEKPAGPLGGPAAAVTAMATPVVTETRPLEILPAGDVATVDATPSPELDAGPKVDLIAGKILERMGDDVQTGALGETQRRKATKPLVAKKAVPRKSNQDGAEAN